MMQENFKMDFETKVQLQDIILKEEMDRKLAIIEVMKKTNASFDPEEALKYDQFDIVEGVEDFEHRIPEFFDTTVLDFNLPAPIQLTPKGDKFSRYIYDCHKRFLKFLLDCDFDLVQSKFHGTEYSTEKKCHRIVLGTDCFFLKQKDLFFINANGNKEKFEFAEIIYFDRIKIPLTERIFGQFVGNIEKIANVKILRAESFMTVEFDKEEVLKTVQIELCFDIENHEDQYGKALNELDELEVLYVREEGKEGEE